MLHPDKAISAPRMEGEAGLMVMLSARLLNVLGREARGDAEALKALCAEAVARRWLAARGVPSWRSAEPPAAKERYSLLLPGWIRALVWPKDGPAPGFDRMAAGKCALGMEVSLDRRCKEGEVTGWLELVDLPRIPPHLEPDEQPALRPPGHLPGRIGERRFHRLLLAAGLLRILLVGEPDPPPPPIMGTEVF